MPGFENVQATAASIHRPVGRASSQHTALPPPLCPNLQVVARLEAVLSQKRFTQLGGLQLEKDVRLLLGEWRQRHSAPGRPPGWVAQLAACTGLGWHAARGAAGARRSARTCLHTHPPHPHARPCRRAV